MVTGKDDMDGRGFFDWETRYPKKIRIEYHFEALYLLSLLIICDIFIFLTWQGWLGNTLKIPSNMLLTFNKYTYYSLAGMIGGLTFDIKYLYRCVARGQWNQDRRLWRILSPFIAMSVAFSIGAMIDSSLLSFTSKTNNTTFISIGFLSGYFADRAVGKMSEIAKVLFGENSEFKSEKNVEK